MTGPAGRNVCRKERKKRAKLPSCPFRQTATTEIRKKNPLSNGVAWARIA